MPDLGIPHDVARIYGGFYTGSVFSWNPVCPFIPVDTTINCCGVSVFRVSKEINSEDQFLALVQNTAKIVEDKSTYTWNFHKGNHFVTYAKSDGDSHIPAGSYLVLHSSASEFKRTHNGLYAIDESWFSSQIKTYRDRNSNRFLRYVSGRTAERFFDIAKSLEQYNRDRHRYIADILVGVDSIDDEIQNLQHYGMPTANSIAIGCQWLPVNEPNFLLLTAPKRTLFFIESTTGGDNDVEISGERFLLQAHGLGKRSLVPLRIEYEEDGICINGGRYKLDEKVSKETSLTLRTFDPEESSEGRTPKLISDVLSLCPGRVIGRLEPQFSYSVGKH